MSKLLASFLVSLPVLGAACIDPVEPTEIAADAGGPELEGAISDHDPEQARRSLVRAPDGRFIEMEVTIRNGRALIEGDIDVGPESSIADPDKGIPRGNVLAVAGDLWPTTTIPYDDSDLDNLLRMNLQIAIARWEAATQFRFVKRTSQTDYLEFVQGSGCSSAVGRTGFGQNVTLESGRCTPGNIMHEIGHALGMYHEQSRSDRDAFVTYYEGNVEFGKAGVNFGTKGTKAGTFDFGSMMLYDSFAFTKNNAPTLLRKDTWAARPRGSQAWTTIRTGEDVPLREARFGDFDGDGRTDAIKFVGGDIFLASGVTGAWTKINTNGIAAIYTGVGQFDADPRADIFRADSTGFYYSSAGTGPWIKINNSEYTMPSLRLGDFNGDGRTDVMRADGTNWYVSWNGTGRWQILNTSTYTFANLIVGQFDDDPADDILITTGSEWKLSSRGSQPATTIGWSSARANDVIVGRFNGNAILDIVRPNAIGRYDISADARGPWTTFANTGGMANGGTPPYGWVQVVDYDGDGIDDILMQGAYTVQRDNLSAGDVAAINSLYFGTWQMSVSGSAPFTQLNQTNYDMSTLRVGDFNGDGRADLFRADGTRWWVSYGGTSGWVQLNTSGYKVGDLAFGDFNGDGRTDVFRTDGTRWWMSSGGTGPWVQRNTSGYTLSKLKFGDLDGNGTTDVFLATGTAWYVSWSGSTPYQKLADSGVTNVALADMNGDGKDDVFYADGTKFLYSKNGTPGWHTLVASGYPLSSLALADFDGDGKADVFRADGTNWYISKGGATTWQLWNKSGYTLPSLRFGDFNGDGRADVVTHFARLAK
jgi:hypothetical protein